MKLVLERRKRRNSGTSRNPNHVLSSKAVHAIIVGITVLGVTSVAEESKGIHQILPLESVQATES